MVSPFQRPFRDGSTTKLLHTVTNIPECHQFSLLAQATTLQKPLQLYLEQRRRDRTPCLPSIERVARSYPDRPLVDGKQHSRDLAAVHEPPAAVVPARVRSPYNPSIPIAPLPQPARDAGGAAGRVQYPQFGPAVQAVVSAAQYNVVAAAVINVTLLVHDLSTKSIFVPSCLATFHPYLWTFATGLIHISRVCAFATRVRVRRPSHHDWRLHGWLSHEVKLCAAHHGVEYELKSESWRSLVLSWVAATATVVHLVYGTLVLSSSTFIDNRRRRGYYSPIPPFYRRCSYCFDVRALRSPGRRDGSDGAHY